MDNMCDKISANIKEAIVNELYEYYKKYKDEALEKFENVLSTKASEIIGRIMNNIEVEYTSNPLYDFPIYEIRYVRKINKEK